MKWNFKDDSSIGFALFSKHGNISFKTSCCEYRSRSSLYEPITGSVHWTWKKSVLGTLKLKKTKKDHKIIVQTYDGCNDNLISCKSNARHNNTLALIETFRLSTLSISVFLSLDFGRRFIEIIKLASLLIKVRGFTWGWYFDISVIANN